MLAEGGHRRVDQPRVDRRHGLVAEPERVERAGPVVLDQHVGGCDELLENLLTVRLFEIEGERAFVGRLRQVARSHMTPAQRAIGAGEPTLIGVVRVLDLDHVGAEQRQLIGGKWAGQHVRRIDHADSFKRTLH